ncbi:MAG: hypothetical protein U0441_01975 [Polyangiaceae bacterium]
MTMPGAQCPQCSALLSPGSAKCGYCGYVTPWGAAQAQQQQRMQSVQADQMRRARILKAENAAKTNMIVSLVTMAICCGPVSIITGILGYRAGSVLKAEGQPRPTSSIVGLVAGVVGMCLTITVLVGTYLDQKAKAEHLAAVGQRLEGKREVEKLDQKIACDLVEEYLTDKGYADKTLDFKEIHCDGAFKQEDRRASQPDVRFAFGTNHYTANACLERRSRWFVIQVGEGLSCADLPPAAPFTAPPRKLSDAEIAADEAKTREDIKKAVSTSAVKTFLDRLGRVRTDAASAPAEETTCSKSALAKYVTGSERKKVATADFDLLNGDKRAWPILTSESLSKILDESRKIEDRSASLADFKANSGPLLVVYKSKLKTWPVVKGEKVSGKDFSYSGGEVDGAMIVYDIEAGTRLCQTKIAFESSEVVDFRKSRYQSEKTSAKEAVEDDFKDHFETAATDAIRKMAPDLRLGYKTLE